MARPLIAVALAQEAAHLDAGPWDVVLTGPGKVTAALTAAAAIAARRPSLVLNVGTAGALRDGMAGVHQIGRVIEHDFDHEGLTALLGEPLPGDVVLDPDISTTLATGDRFVQGGKLRDEIALRADLVDMEGYAVARACAAAGVDCEMWKVVSDEATEGALRSWQETIDASARQIAALVRSRFG